MVMSNANYFFAVLAVFAVLKLNSGWNSKTLSRYRNLPDKINNF